MREGPGLLLIPGEEGAEVRGALSSPFSLPFSLFPRLTCPQLCSLDINMGLMKTPVDLSKDIDEHCPAVLIISLREEMKGMGQQVSVRCQSR